MNKPIEARGADIIHQRWADNDRLHFRDPETGRGWWMSCTAPVRKYEAVHGYCVEYQIHYHKDRKTRTIGLIELEGETKGLPAESGALYEGDKSIRRDLAYLFGAEDNIPPYRLIFDLVCRAAGFSMPKHWSPGYVEPEDPE
jgi:hypothetical protein